jgi:alpha-L-rhamnosidase
LWDSGRIEGAHCTGIAYAGQPLRSSQACHWKVAVWDRNDKQAWSGAAQWEMGLLAAADWQGKWLAVEDAVERDDRLAGAQWVHAPATSPQDARQFRLIFSSGEGEATLFVMADGIMSNLMIDGSPLSLPLRDPAGFGGAPALKIPLQFTGGSHAITLSVAPAPGFFVKPIVALAAQLRQVGPSGETERITQGWEVGTGQEGAWARADVAAEQPHFPWPPTPARLLCRAFMYEGKHDKARLHVAALGGYRIWLNGKRVNDDELQAQPSDYDNSIPYRSYDVGHLVLEGENSLGVMVGDGFYASYQAPDGRYSYGAAPRRLKLCLDITQADGAIVRVASDHDWRHVAAPVQMSEIYAGEDQDLRLWPRDWHRPHFAPADWAPVWEAPEPSAAIVSACCEPIRVIRMLEPVAVRKMGIARHIVDFGQNFAGRVRLRIHGREGQEINVRHAELLTADGELDRRNLRAARAADRYWLRGDGSEEVLEPVFTYQGFRYAEIEGVSDLDAKMISALVLSTALEETGTLKIDQPDLQKLWLNMLWSQRSNFMGIPTDCPQRDERLGWTGDAQLFWDTASFTMDTGAFTRGYTRILRDAQNGKGAYPLWAPGSGGSNWGDGTATPGWSDAGVMLPYVAFLHSGDRVIVDENWSAMTAYLDGIIGDNPDGLWSKGRGADLGDWLALDAKAPGDETTPKALIGTAMLARSIEQVGKMAEWTGRTAEASRWRARHAIVAEAFSRTFIKSDGYVGNGSHCSYILALGLDLVPQSLRKQAATLLVADIRRRGTLLSTGFLGTPMALDALADVGEHKLVWDLLLRTAYPSWGYMVRHGATTIWERWNGDTGDVAMNSFNHYALGAVCGFLHRRVGAIEPIEPGFARFRVAPVLDKRSTNLAATLDSARGRIQVEMKTNRRSSSLHLVVPTNSVADVHLSDQVMEFGPGTHNIPIPSHLFA